MRTSSQSYDATHLKILPTLLEAFLRHLSYCRKKALYEGYDKVNEFSNSKCELVSRFNNIQQSATELASKDTFLRTCKSLLNYNRRLIMQFKFILSAAPQSNSTKIQIFQLVNMVNHSGSPLAKCLA